MGTPPIKTETLRSLSEKETLSFQAHWQVARDPNLDPAERLAAAKACLALDGQHCGVHFVAGRLLFERGEATAAKEHLTAARDFDVCPLRATTAMIDSVETIAKENDIPLVDTIALLDQRSHDGRRIADNMADPEFFVDHVHPTIAGHQIIAAALAERLERLGWIKHTVETEQRYQSLSQEHLKSLSEAYYARGKQRLEGLRRWAAGRAGDLGIE